MNRAFSLVELSIVLVILGLLTGGILTGQSLIRAAELRAVTTEFQTYQTAVMTFRDKYFALPGDMRNAEEFWGTMASGTCPNATAGTGTQTCNGGGDGELNFAGAGSQTGEIFTFWQQLANAGLIEGTYSGIAGSGGSAHSVIATNVPRSKISQAGWSARTVNNFAGNANSFAYDYQNSFVIGAQDTTGPTYQPVFTPEEVWNIDTKIDDGRPGTGKILPIFWDTCTDAATHGGTTASDRINASYLLTVSSTECSIHTARSF